MRYFVVFYVGTNNQVGQVYGVAAVESNKYPGLKGQTDDIIKAGKLNACSITNIIELSKADFDEFKR